MIVKLTKLDNVFIALSTKRSNGKKIYDLARPNFNLFINSILMTVYYFTIAYFFLVLEMYFALYQDIYVLSTDAIPAYYSSHTVK